MGLSRGAQCRLFGLVWLLVAALVGGGCSWVEPDPLDGPTWIPHLEAVEVADAPETRQVASWVASSLLEEEPKPWPLGEDREVPRVIFVTVGDGERPAAVLAGVGEGWRQAAEEALRDPSLASIGRPEIVKVDLVTEVSAAGRAGPSTPLPWDRTLEGLALGARGLGWLPEELVSGNLVGSDGVPHLQRLSRTAKAVSGGSVPEVVWGWRTPRWRFTTSSWAQERGGSLRPLRRGAEVSPDVDPPALRLAARRAGAYLTGMIDEDGRFVYDYRSKFDRPKDGYNILRHAGTTWSMIDLFSESQDPQLGAAVARAVAHLMEHVVPCSDGAESRCVVEADHVKLGGQGLALVALAAHHQVSGAEHLLPDMRAMARWVVETQSEQGEFTRHKVRHSSGEVSDFISGYYPGEAILGLMRLYAIDPDPRWKDAAAAAARWLIQVRDGDTPTSSLPHDHWLLYALNDLHAVDPDPLFVSHAEKIVEAILSAQHVDPEDPDWVGGWYRPPRTTPTATRTEGLMAAHQLFERAGRREALPPIREAVERALRFQLRMQFGPTQAMYLPAPARALGGVRNSFDNFDVRIDYVQHTLSAMLAYARWMEGASSGQEQGAEPPEP